MKSTNPRIERLKQLLALEERRANLQQEVDTLAEQMHSLRESIFDGVASATTSSSADESSSPAPRRRGRPPGSKAGGSAPAASASSSRPAPQRRGGRRKRGALKEQIFEAMHAAGQAGVRVTELAKQFAMNPVNIHSWFHSALNRHPEIKKLQGGHYRLDGGGSSSSSQSSSAPVKRGPGRPPKNASTSASSSRPKAGGRAPRGQLSSSIISELQSAGAKGIHVRDLSEKIGAPYKNIYIWFATTGKKNKGIRKLGPAHYRIS